MNILLLGGGGREHALAWKLRQSPRVDALFAMPGNDGMQQLAVSRLAGDPCDAAAVLAAVRAHSIDLTVVGPEAPLARGVADELRQAGAAVFGPSQKAALLESSKAFAKEFMARHGIPTARFEVVDNSAAARRALRKFSCPVVIKADGLAAGKGVVIAQSEVEALDTVDAMLAGRLVGGAGRRIVLEECLQGLEISLLAVADGNRFVSLAPARDHKRVFDGDRGPNTGGMGAFSTSDLLEAPLLRIAEESILRPAIASMAADGDPFQGLLYCGLMLTAAGPRVLEFNVRFGDPEAQAILMRFDGDLAALLDGAARGVLPTEALFWSQDASACVIAASDGYPGAYRSDLPIEGLDTDTAPAVIFHAGTRRLAQGWVTGGGRVIGVAARAPRLSDALRCCYRALERIHFPGMHYRTDIGRNVAAAR